LLGLARVLAACGGEAPGDPRPVDSGVHLVTRLDTGLVVTASGPLQETVSDGVATFLGIPFAAPPVAERRRA
jgi:hypothetical protein